MSRVEDLIGACASWPDAALRADFADTVLPEASTDRERDLLAAYYRARTRHASFKPGSWTTSNHHQVAAAWRQQAAAAAASSGPGPRRCRRPGCGRELRGRADQAYCGQRCRKAASRAR